MTLRAPNRSIRLEPWRVTARVLWPIALGLGLSACSSGFEAVSVYPRVHYDDGAGEVFIYGHGFEPGATAAVTWFDANGVAQSAAFESVEVIDAYTLRARLPDLGGQLPYGIYPYREFVSNPVELTPGLYTCGDDPQPAIWERGKTEGYCDAFGAPLAYAPAGQQTTYIPPGAEESSWFYAGWYESLTYCYYGGAAGDLSEEQLRLLVPDYGLGCFYPEADGNVPTSFTYCPVQTPATPVSVVINLPDGRQSVIAEAVTFIDYDLDYYSNEEYGYRVRGSFGAPLDVAVGADAGPLTITDLDDDGTFEVIVASPLSSTVAVLWGPDYDPGDEGTATWTVGDTPVSVVTADINGDGALDIVTANEAGSSLTVLYNDGGDFSMSRQIDLTVSPSAVEAADLDGDDLADLVVGSEADEVLQVFLQGAGEDFSTATTYDDIAVVDLAVGDLDGKTGIDIVASSSVNDALYVLVNNGAADFSQVSDPTAPVHIEEIATSLVEVDDVWVNRVVDLNGDTFADIAAIHDDADPAQDMVLVFRGYLDNTEQKRYYPRYATSYRLPAGPRAITITDVNGDAYEDDLGTFNLDLVTVNDDGAAGLLVNEGNGAFSLLKTVPVGPAPAGVASMDLDDDGDFDLVVTNSIADEELGLVSLLSNPSTIFEYLELTLNYCE